MKFNVLSKKSAVISVEPYPDALRHAPPPKEFCGLFPVELVEELEAFPFEKNEEGLKIAAVDPQKISLQDFVKNRFPGENILWFKCAEQDVALVLKHSARDFKAEIGRLTANENEINGNIIEIVDRIVNYAFVEKASDVHVEPLRNETVVRFRIDGVLHSILTIPRKMHSSVVARFKILGDLKIDEYRRPQDGRIELEKLPDTSIRISTVPTLYGEKVAMRIMDDSHKNLSLSHLGFSEAQESILRRNVEKPFGMIVTSGPTGSGKTTTLYGLLHMIRRDGINISTLEDPVEYALSGVNQIQINPRVDLTFASGLRALLRQDPDVIMVGEVRDSDTAIMAANAALTGHLVLTTMHTNDAPSAFTRLMEMRVEDFVVGSVVNLVIAQRLVRQICSECTAEDKLSEDTIKKVRDRSDVRSALKRAGYDMEIVEKMPFRIGKGCEKCVGTGHAGRAGIFELLELNKDIHDAIITHASAEHIREIAEKNGYRPMIDDGVAKVLAGYTTFDEIIRVTRNS